MARAFRPGSDLGETPLEPAARAGWLFIAILTAAVTAVSTYQSLRRYEALRSAWSWDLAYYNQWFWAVTHGLPEVTVRPLSSYAEEGPSVWKMNYLAPIRFLLIPVYRLAPDPRTLLVIQSVIFWWVIPAAYTLVRSESRSEWVAISAAALVLLAPGLWPLALNDFRELQLAGPFVLWSIQGVRGRSRVLAAAGIAGLLACRQEFAVLVASLALLPPREPEGWGPTVNWRTILVLIGSLWLFVAFFAYLKFWVARTAPEFYIQQFLGPKPSARETFRTALELVVVGMGAWTVLACLAPRAMLLAVPWIWGVSSGRWALDSLSRTDWHHVRYAAPAFFVVLAAGLLGYARLAGWLLRRQGGRNWLVLAWLATAAGCGGCLLAVMDRLAHVPIAIDQDEAAPVWRWIGQVGPNEAVIADMQVAAPLSSRARLYGYALDSNLPGRSSRLGPEIRWLFVRNDFPFRNVLLDQGFQIVHQGSSLTIGRRVLAPPD